MQCLLTWGKHLSKVKNFFFNWRIWGKSKVTYLDFEQNAVLTAKKKKKKFFNMLHKI